MRYRLASICALGALATGSAAWAATDYPALFEATWKTVDESYYDPTFGGRDWKAIGARYRPQVAGVRDDAGFRKVADAMLAYGAV